MTRLNKSCLSIDRPTFREVCISQLGIQLRFKQRQIANRIDVGVSPADDAIHRHRIVIGRIGPMALRGITLILRHDVV